MRIGNLIVDVGTGTLTMTLHPAYVEWLIAHGLMARVEPPDPTSSEQKP